MVFNSYAFLFLYLPIVLFGWYWLNHLRAWKIAQLFLIGASLVFYGCFSWTFVPVLLVSCLINYGISYRSARLEADAFDDAIEEGRPDPFDRSERHRKVLLVFGVVFNLCYLVAFKYGVEQLNGILSIPGISSFVMPVGISYYTLSQISFVIERCQNTTAHDSFLNYMTCATFFPKLAEGPITTYDEIAAQFEDPEKKCFHAETFLRGLCLLVFGMAKKMLLADTLAPLSDFCFQQAYYLDTLTMLLGLLAYAMQLYFDFSGYIDMAIGVAKLFNIELPDNFRRPFQATSFGRLWQRWHMTLNRFFTRYVYIPLGGSRAGDLRTCLNILVVFVLSALWHGTQDTYLVWGVLCGVLVILANHFLRHFADQVRNPFGVFFLRALVLATFALVFSFFGAPDLNHATALWRRLLVPTWRSDVWPGFLYRCAGQLDLPETYLLTRAVRALAPDLSDQVNLEIVLAVLALCLVLVYQKRNAREMAENMRLSVGNAVLVALLFVWCLTSMTGVTTFLYFRY